MEPYVLLELLKFLWLGFELVHYFINRKREKTLVGTLEGFQPTP